MNDTHDESGRAGGFARAALTLAALWILAGALFKLTAGSPGDLPPIVRETFAIDLGLKYRLAIGIELAVVATALFRPGLGWLLVMAQLLVFEVVLALSLGEDSCGCFGSDVPISPALMLGIDSALFLALLAARPWRGFRGRHAPLALMGVVVAIVAALPWLFDREIQLEDGPQLSPNTEQGDTGEMEGSGWIEFKLAAWEGQLVHDTPLAQFVDPNSLPDTGLYVLWRWDCDHCAKHLAAMAEKEHGERMIVLLRLESAGDHEGNRAVYQKPSGPFVVEVNLPPTVEYVVTTPGELDVEGYTILRGEEGVSD